MNRYTPKQLEYIRSVDGNAHMSAVEIIGDLEARHNALRHNTKVIIKAYRENRKKYNALVEAVAWERECLDTWEYGTALKMQALDEQVASMNAARAEVDRLIADCEGEG